MPRKYLSDSDVITIKSLKHRMSEIDIAKKYHIDVAVIYKIWKSDGEKTYTNDDDKHELDKFEKLLSTTENDSIRQQRDDFKEQLEDLQQRYKILRDKYNSAENLREDNIELTRRNNSLLANYNAMEAVVRKHRYYVPQL